jgi:hypothetical protein
MMIVYVLVYAPVNILTFLVGFKFNKGQSKVFKIYVLIGRNATKVPLDVYFFAKFIENFVYLIKKKSESLAAKDRKLSRLNLFIVYWTVLNLVLKIIHSISNNVLVTLYVLLPEEPTPWQDEAFNFMIRTMVFLADFLNAVTLLYLFYCQAQAQKKQSGHINQRSQNDEKDEPVTYSGLIQDGEDSIKGG